MANGGGGTNSNGFVKTGSNGLGTNYGGADFSATPGAPRGVGSGDSLGQFSQAPAPYTAPDYGGYQSQAAQAYGGGTASAIPNSGVSTLPPSGGGYPPPSAGGMNTAPGGPMPEAYPYPLGTPGAPSSSGMPLMNNGMPAPWDHEARTWQKIDRAFINQGNRGLSGPALEAARQDMYQREMARIASHGGGFRQPPPRPQRPARTLPQNGLLGPVAPAAPAAPPHTPGQFGRFGFGS